MKGLSESDHHRTPVPMILAARTLPATPTQYLDGMGQGRKDYLEALLAGPRAARQVDDERPPADAGHGPAEYGVGRNGQAPGLMASAIPGASRSTTAIVASGVTSRERTYRPW